MRTHQRVRRHISGPRGGHVFIPQWRMRQIRWEEAVVNARANREGRDKANVQHMDCHCGSIGCLRTPIDVGKRDYYRMTA